MQELDIFFCEDTRTTRKLFRMYDIDYRTKQFYSITSFTNEAQMNGYLQLMYDNDCALVSEAGMP